jgi:hypothetical protein
LELTPDIVENYVSRIKAIISSPAVEKWEENIKRDGLEVKLALMPMVPSDDNGDPFAIAFPRGFPHMKQRDGPRVSMAGGLSAHTDTTKESERKRKFDYVYNQSRMAFDENSARKVAAERQPFSDGATHRQPGYAATLVGSGGAFSRLCFTPDDAARLRKAMWKKA